MDTFQSTGGIEETFRENQAKWHDSCRLRFNKTELSCAKRKMEAKPEENERKFLRSDKVVIDTDTTFFYDTPEGISCDQNKACTSSHSIKSLLASQEGLHRLYTRRKWRHVSGGLVL